jgi:hypothetical protein
MWSNGGAIGGYEVRAFRIVGGQVTELVITKKAEDEFERKHPCPDRGHNIYAVRWLKGSEELLLAMQVYPTSDCGKELGLDGLPGQCDGWDHPPPVFSATTQVDLARWLSKRYLSHGALGL